MRWTLTPLSRASMLPFALSACAATHRVSSVNAYCAPPTVTPKAWNEDPAPRGASHVERVAALLGVADEVRSLEAGTAESPERTRVLILQRLDFARTAIEATVAELDCEGERAEQLASYLERRQSTVTTRLTISSIVVGAATGIATGFLQQDHELPAEESIAAVGGTATALLALAPLWVRPTVEFRHERNMLAEVWEGPATATGFPDVVWAYLTRPEFSNEQRESIRTRVVARWKEYGTVDRETVEPERDAPRPLLFGPGGRYDGKTLRQRAEMLDQVKAEVRLMNQDLADLSALLNALP